MSSAALSTLVVVALISGQRVKDEDKAKLRELAHIPSSAVYAMNGMVGIDLDEDECAEDYAKELEKTRTALECDKTDLKLNVRLAELLWKCGSKEDAKKADQTAATLCRDRLIRQPDDVRAMTCLARCTTTSDEETERLLRRAVKVDPLDAEAWAGLGDRLFGAGTTSLFGISQPKSAINCVVALARLAERQNLAEEDLTRAIARFEEARRCHGKAAEIESRNGRRLWEFGKLCVMEDYWLNTLRSWLDNTSPALEKLISAESRDVCVRAADLCPKDYRIVKTALLVELLTLLNREGSDDSPIGLRSGDGGVMGTVERRMRKQVARLEASAADGDEKTVIQCAELLVPMYARFLPDRKRQEAWSLRAIELGSKDDRFWASLFEVLHVSENHAELLRYSLKNVRRKDTALARNQLAFAYTVVHDYKEAEHQLTMMLTRFPDDVRASLGMAAMLMRPGRDDKSRMAAGLFLDGLKPVIDKEEFKDIKCDYLVLRGIQLALGDQRERAGRVLTSVLELEPKHDAACKALTLLGLPATPQPPNPSAVDDE